MNWDDASDAELVRRFKSGDDRAFDAIVLRFQDRIYRLACVSLIDQQSAADVTQEVLVRSHKGLRRFRFRAEPFTWVYRTTKLVCREFNRRRRGEAIDDELPDTSALPEQLVADFERTLEVRELVAGLPERQREVVMLRIFEDLSVRQTAGAMGVSEGTVKALLYKAKERLGKETLKRGIGND